MNGNGPVADRPHVMPVWGVWLEGRLWLSSGRRSRKARHLEREPRCSLTTDDARDPVVVDGVAVNAKYGGGLTVEFQDPAVNGTYGVRPFTIIALSESDFAGSPTRWRFPTA